MTQCETFFVSDDMQLADTLYRLGDGADHDCLAANSLKYETSRRR